MIVHRVDTPLPWREVMLAAAPGVLLALSRMAYLASWLGWLSALLSVLVIGWALVASLRRKALTAWSLSLLGLVASLVLLTLASLGLRVLDMPSIPGHTLLDLSLVLILWTPIALLVWAHARTRSIPWLVWVLSAAMVLIQALTLTPYLIRIRDAFMPTLVEEAVSSTLINVGFLLLPVALGLPLLRRHGLPAILFVLGEHGIWLFDSDSLLTYWLRDTRFVQAYIVLLPALIMVVAPVWLLRSRSRTGQALALLVPVGVVLIARVAAPWAVRRMVPPSGDIMASVEMMLVAVLVLVLYQQADSQATPGSLSTTSQPAPSNPVPAS